MTLLLLSVIFRQPMYPGTISGTLSRKPKPPTPPNQAKSPHHENSPQDKDGQGLSEMILDPIAPKIECR